MTRKNSQTAAAATTAGAAGRVPVALFSDEMSVVMSPLAGPARGLPQPLEVLVWQAPPALEDEQSPN
ncbi:hypothetical protein [Streptomyces sp. NPDC002057]|uniref:hypothetical protein n=1 Tax=Streptomyces sp. NPDC002057 TaxID=3154664 RepID=UPI00332B72A1